MDEYRYEPGPDQQASMNQTQTTTFGSKLKKEIKTHEVGEVSMPKIFVWLGIGLLITAVISLCVPYIVMALTDGFTQNPEIFSGVYIGMLVVSLILMIPSSLMMAFKVGAKNTALMKAGYFIYTVAMGMMLSSLLLVIYAITYNPTEEAAYLNPTFLSTVSMSFFITAGSFLVMGVIGSFTKHMNAAIPVVLTGAIGCLIMSIVNLFLRVDSIYWIIDFVLFGLILLVTAIDMHNIKKIAESSKGLINGTNLSIYCAYCLYVDFINILVRVLYYVLIFTSNKKK